MIRFRWLFKLIGRMTYVAFVLGLQELWPTATVMEGDLSSTCAEPIETSISNCLLCNFKFLSVRYDIYSRFFFRIFHWTKSMEPFFISDKFPPPIYFTLHLSLFGQSEYSDKVLRNVVINHANISWAMSAVRTWKLIFYCFTKKDLSEKVNVSVFVSYVDNVECLKDF